MQIKIIFWIWVFDCYEGCAVSCHVRGQDHYMLKLHEAGSQYIAWLNMWIIIEKLRLSKQNELITSYVH